MRREYLLIGLSLNECVSVIFVSSHMFIVVFIVILQSLERAYELNLSTL